MIRTGGIAVYIDGDWKFTHVNYYNGSNWELVTPYVYDGGWKKVGAAGVNMVKFLTSAGEDLVTSDGKTFLVREF